MGSLLISTKKQENFDEAHMSRGISLRELGW